MKPLRKHIDGGQSLAEFALILPIFLTIVGACIDVARIYHGWIDLEAATRDAAQHVATDPGYTTTGGYYDPTDGANYCASFPCTNAPSADAKAVLDRVLGRPFTKASAQDACTSPKVWASLESPSSSSIDGGNSAYPVATAVVKACLPFRTLFAYPWFTQNGDWVLRVERTYKVIVGR